MINRNRVAAFCAVSAAGIFIQSVQAQNWRADNPDQPNGYRASEAASHYHGDLHAPAQPLNGYRASEARSHYGGERCEPSNGWNYQYTNGPGSAFTNSSYYNNDNMPGSAYSSQKWYQNGGPQNSLPERMQRAARWQQELHNLGAAGYAPRYGSAANGYASESSTMAGYRAPSEAANNAGQGMPYQQPGYTSFASRLQTFMPMIGREDELRQRAIQRVEDGGGFNRIYAGQ